MSKNMYTNRNTHDTNCHRNYGGPNKDAVTTGTFEQADRTDDFDYDYLGKQALAAFYWLRELRGIEKKPSTSELVDWLRALVAGGVDPERLEKEIPFAGVLLKKDKDSLS